MNSKFDGDNMNFKRSIEIRNGIAIRSTNNVHRMNNSITLNCYIVSALTDGEPANFIYCIRRPY